MQTGDIVIWPDGRMGKIIYVIQSINRVNNKFFDYNGRQILYNMLSMIIESRYKPH